MRAVPRACLRHCGVRGVWRGGPRWAVAAAAAWAAAPPPPPRPAHFPAVPPLRVVPDALADLPAFPPPPRCGALPEGPKLYDAFVSLREYGRLRKFLRTLRWQRAQRPEFAAQKPSVGQLVLDALQLGELYPDPEAYAVCAEACGEAGEAEAVLALQERAAEEGWLHSSPALQHAVLQAHCSLGNRLALDVTLSRLRDAGVPLEGRTLALLVDWYAGVGAAPQVAALLAEACDRRLSDASLAHSLLRACGADGRGPPGGEAGPSARERLEHSMDPEVLLQAYILMEDEEGVNAALRRLEEAGGPPQQRYAAQIALHGRCGRMAEAQAAYAALRRSGLALTPAVFTALVEALAGQPEPDAALLAQWWDEMYAARVRPTATVVALSVAAGQRAGHRDLTKQCLRRALQLSVPLDSGVAETLTENNLLSFAFEMAMGYALIGSPSGPAWTYDTFDHLDIVAALEQYGMLRLPCFNLALRRAFQCRRLDVVSQLLEAMDRLHCPLDRVLYTTVIVGYAEAGPLHTGEAFRWHRHMLGHGVREARAVLEALLRASAHPPHQAKQATLLQRLGATEQPVDEGTLQSLMMLAAEQRDAARAQELWDFAAEVGLTPNRRTRALYEEVTAHRD